MQIEKKLYKVERVRNVRIDEVASFLIRAYDSRQARQIAAANRGDESSTEWLKSKYSKCRQVKPNGKLGVIIQNFRGC